MGLFGVAPFVDEFRALDWSMIKKESNLVYFVVKIWYNICGI